jgi:peptide/nickel transport system ATP-binding protein/oligopeptide transport system ATP-binding protein
MALLQIKDLQLQFGDGPDAVRALDGVSLSIDSGETLGLVGESGSGKSVTALSIARLLPPQSARYVGGQILLDGHDVLRMAPAQLPQIRGGLVNYIFQEPGASLNPVFRIGRQIKETLKLHRPEAATDAEVIGLLKRVGIPAPESRIHSYPHQMSGGMQQRVMIAMALAARPKLLIADEPTTALDVTIQAQIIELLRSIKEQFNMAIILITHNLGIVGDLADRLAVMYAGQIVETGPAREVLHRPMHPYTRALIDSVPALGSDSNRFRAIPGAVPRLSALPSGCRFHPRCRIARPQCSSSPVPLSEAAPARHVRCPYAEDTLRLP